MKERAAMDNENMLGATELPVDVSELGELCSAELERPGVYHLAVKPETDYCPFPMEYYLVLNGAPISKEAMGYGTPLENGQGIVFSLEQESSGAKIIEYEIFKYRVMHHLPLPGNETLHGCAVYAAELYPEYFGMLPAPALTRGVIRHGTVPYQAASTGSRLTNVSKLLR